MSVKITILISLIIIGLTNSKVISVEIGKIIDIKINTTT